MIFTWIRSDDPVLVLPSGLLVADGLEEDPQHGQEVQRQQGVVNQVEHADLNCKTERLKNI